MRDLSKRIDSANPTEEELENLLYWVAERTKPKPKEPASLISLSETWEAAQKLHGDESGVGGLSTGYDSIDEMTGGLRDGQLIVIFGDTNHGKSLFAQNIAYNVAIEGTPVLWVGLEMPNAENTERFQGFGCDPTLPILYPPEISLDPKTVEPVIKAAVEQGVGLVAIDHLHMFEGLTGENEAQFITNACREMKMLAIKYSIPIILISHISARPEAEEKNPPQLRHLKGSTSIKQLADNVLAVHNDGKVNDLPGPAELLILQRKARRYRQRTSAKLRILSNARLAESTPSFSPTVAATSRAAIPPHKATYGSAPLPLTEGR